MKSITAIPKMRSMRHNSSQPAGASPGVTTGSGGPINIQKDNKICQLFIAVLS